MNQDPLSPFKIARTARDATVVIRGYVFQVNVTLLRWLTLSPGEALALEAGEDVDTIRQALDDSSETERLLEDIKHRESHLTLRSPAALAALASFHEHQANNPGMKLRFRYVTNAVPGREKPSINDSKVPGIYLWERIQNDEVHGKKKRALISKLSSTLQQCAKPEKLSPTTWRGFNTFLKSARQAEMNRFINSFEWAIDQGSLEEIEAQVLFAIRKSTDISDHHQLRLAHSHLFFFVFSILSQRKPKLLTSDVLQSQLTRFDQAEPGRQLLTRLNSLGIELHTRLNSIDEALQDVRPVLAGIAERVQRLDAAQGAKPKQDQGEVLTQSTDQSTLDFAMQSPAGSVLTESSENNQPNMVSLALALQNEGLAAGLALQAKDQVAALRDLVQKGRRLEALEKIKSQKANRAAWQVLPNERKADFLRLEVSILLGTQADTTAAKSLLAEAEAFGHKEGNSRLRAWLDFLDGNIDLAVERLAETKEPESDNLRALFFAIKGRPDDALKTLPPIDKEPSVRAETLRVQTLALLQKCDLLGAHESIENAIDARPDWPTLRALSAKISYYEALSPSALPPPLDGSANPSTLLFVINSPDKRARLRKAAEQFSQLLNAPEESVDDRRFIESWLLACLGSDRQRLEEARDFASKVLARDPGNYRLVPWVLSLGFDEIDLTATECHLGDEIGSEPDLHRIFSLVMLKIRKGKAAEALKILNSHSSSKPFIDDKGFQHLQALALFKSGESSQAQSLLQHVDPQHSDPVWSEIFRAEALRTGDWTSYSEHLRHRYELTKLPDALIKYCEFEAGRGNWTIVAAMAPELLSRLGTANSLRLAAIAELQANDPESAISLLESRRDLFDDVDQSEELLQLAVAARTKTGDLLGARRDAEHLVKAFPSTENLVRLARIQLDTGDLKAMAISARRLGERTDLEPSQALRVAALIRREDPTLAESLWRRVVSAGIPDESVAMAVDLGYRLGLDPEMKPLLARMYELGDAGEAGIHRKTVADLVEIGTQHNKDQQWATSIYQQGEMAIQLIPSRLREELAVLFHSSLLDREAQEGRFGGGIFVRHGGRVTQPTLTDDLSSYRLNLDLTSVLLAAHLGILEKLEQTFSLRVPPSIFLGLTAMQDSITSGQISQIEAARQVLSAVDERQISLLAESGHLDPELANLADPNWARSVDEAIKSGGYVVDLLPKIALHPRERILDLPAHVYNRLINCRTVLETLRANGIVSQEKYEAGIIGLGSEGRQAPLPGPLAPDTDLYIETTIAKLLAQADLLKAVTRAFRVHMAEEDVARLRGRVQTHDTAQGLGNWLDRLISHLRQAIEQNTIALIPINVHKDNDPGDRTRAPEVRCMMELLTFSPSPNDVVCCDDRYFNGFAHVNGEIPITCTTEVLAALCGSGNLAPEEYFRFLIQVRSAGLFFVSLETGELLHHLSQTVVQNDGTITETRELGILRRYWARALLSGKNLQRPGRSLAGRPLGESIFVQESVNAIREALVSVWLKGPETPTLTRAARSEWLLECLQLELDGIQVLTELLPGFENKKLIAITFGEMVLAGFKERLTTATSLARLKQYLHWVEERILQEAFAREPVLIEKTATFLRDAVDGIAATGGQPNLENGKRFALVLLQLLPPMLKGAVEDNEDFRKKYGITTVVVVNAGDIQFERSEYLQAAEKAVNGEQAMARTIRRREEVTFRPQEKGNSPTISLKTQNAGPFVIADPWLALLYQDPLDRQSTLFSHDDWFDCDPFTKEEAVREIANVHNLELRIEQAQHWIDKSAAVFYNNLPHRLRATGSILTKDLKPPDPVALLRHYRLGDQNVSVSFHQQLESGMAITIEQYGLTDALVRFAGFPLPLPANVCKAVIELPENELDSLVAVFCKHAGSPLSAIHLLRIFANMEDGPRSRNRKMANRTLKYLCSDQGIRDCVLLGRILKCVEGWFAAWKFFSDSPEQRLAMTWAHAHRIFATVRHLAIDEEWLLSRFEGDSVGLCHELLGRETELMTDVSHSNRFAPEHFLVAGLCYALKGKSPTWCTESEREMIRNLIRRRTDNRVFATSLMRDQSLASNRLGSFLNCDHGPFLSEWLNDESINLLSFESLKAVVAESVGMLTSENAQPKLWQVIFHILGDLSTSSDVATLIGSAILKIDIDGFQEDAELAGDVLFAAALQAPALKSHEVTEHISSQVIQLAALLQRRVVGQRIPEADETIASSLMHLCAFLSWSSGPERQTAEFTRLLTLVFDACPATLRLYRPVLEQLRSCSLRDRACIWPLVVRSRAFD